MDWTLMGFVAVNFLAAMSGAIFAPDAWYRALRKPSWQPPDFLFAPVWLVIFGLIAVSGWMVWRKVGGLEGAPLAFAVYGLQLVLNALWSAIFFGAKRMGVAFFECLALWAAIVVNIVLFWRIDAFAGALLLPYVAWVSFAAFLNFTVWRLNPDADAPRVVAGRAEA